MFLFIGFLVSLIAGFAAFIYGLAIACIGYYQRKPLAPYFFGALLMLLGIVILFLCYYNFPYHITAR